MSGVSSFEDLPAKAKEYIAFIEDFCETRVGIISVGCRRDETIVREDVW
ncbi:MAG: adenylosuccinate synthetase [Spirochaetaceae bacterium]|nr:adenylosuccinate synthetase [Spirochaetaceae bacterium]